MNDINIISFSVGTVKYIHNEEYETCKKILNIFDLDDSIYDKIKIADLGGLIEKNYIVDNIKSFIPDSHKHIKRPYIYNSNIPIDETREYHTIDKTLCYTSCIYNLDYLISCDWRTTNINTEIKDITPHYIYNVTVEESTVLIIQNGLYVGSHLIEAKKQGVEFKIIEEIETTKSQNIYKSMIDKLIKVLDIYNNEENRKHFKIIINKLIGTFETSIRVSHTIKNTMIYNNDSSDAIKGFKIKYDDEHVINYEREKTIKTIYNKKLISIQIKDAAQLLIYNKIKELELEDKDIIKIKTDSIMYYGKLPKGLKNDINGWKEETNKYDESVIDNVINNKFTSLFIEDDETDTTKRILYNCYAGTGKTYYIINSIIPELEKEGKTYIVLAPTHKALVEFHEQDKNNEILCDVIQNFTLHNTIPNYDYVIIDEIGMCDKSAHDLLYKLKMLNRNFICLGDFNQLLPFGENEPLNKPHYINFLFNEIKDDILIINRRNNFPISYYDDLINGKLNPLEEVNKYSSKKWDSMNEVCITYRIETAKKYHNKYFKNNNIKPLETGNKYICLSNNYRKDGIFNGTECIITQSNKELITLDTSAQTTIKKFNNNFMPSCALNIHKLQGGQVTTYYWAKEDNIFITNDRKDSNRIAYTIISRLKGNVYKV